ncbi:hypothetical protein O9G_005684 [Rozella allomycis CSF55]|uniref:Uncharacterized protein n=1 Tax=Rozella allomycis (strain CSF55) TaxID=988480 RepID=A0A075B440_ROZAC|nr:hypothetical protein O9G_005684 [Rozella allomycis CSF55]|eukprot:EPZ36000.1 hypothetical protein O9G_005684 [Rozella allomycis CSF55]
MTISRELNNLNESYDYIYRLVRDTNIPKCVNTIMELILNDKTKLNLKQREILHYCLLKEKLISLDKKLVLKAGIRIVKEFDGRLIFRSYAISDDNYMLLLDSDLLSCEDIFNYFLPRVVDHEYVQQNMVNHSMRCKNQNCPIKEYSCDIFKYFCDQLSSSVYERYMKPHTYRWLLTEKSKTMSQQEINDYFYSNYVYTYFQDALVDILLSRVTGLKKYFMEVTFTLLDKSFDKFAMLVIDEITEDDLSILDDRYKYVTDSDISYSTDGNHLSVEDLNFDDPLAWMNCFDANHERGWPCECEDEEFELTDEVIKEYANNLLRRDYDYNFNSDDLEYAESKCSCYLDREIPVSFYRCHCGFAKLHIAGAMEYLRILSIRRQQFRYLDLFKAAVTNKKFDMIDRLIPRLNLFECFYAWVPIVTTESSEVFEYIINHPMFPKLNDSMYNLMTKAYIYSYVGENFAEYEFEIPKDVTSFIYILNIFVSDADRIKLFCMPFYSKFRPDNSFFIDNINILEDSPHEKFSTQTWLADFFKNSEDQ